MITKNKHILLGILILTLFYFKIVFLGHTIFPEEILKSNYPHQEKKLKKNNFISSFEHLNHSYPHYRDETGDIIYQFIPFIKRNNEEILPLWNKDVNSGTPHFANGLSSVLNPANLIFRKFDPFKTYGLRIVFLATIGLIGMFLLLIRFDISHFSALCGSLSYVFCINTTSWMHNISVFGTIVIIPWFFIFYKETLLSDKIINKNSVICSIFFSIIIFMGYYPSILQTLILMMISSIIKVYIDKKGYMSNILRLFKINGSIILLGSCLGAIQLLPAIDLALKSNRLNIFMPYQNFTYQPIISLFSFMFYRIFGFPTDNAFHAYTFNSWQYSEAGIGYLGALSMGIILYYFLTRKNEIKPHIFIRTLFLSLTIFILIAKFTPLYTFIPFQNVFKIHRLTTLIAFSGTILLGVSLDHLILQFFKNNKKVINRLILEKIFGIWLLLAIIISLIIFLFALLILKNKEFLNIIYDYPFLYVRSEPPEYYIDIVTKLIGSNIYIISKPLLINCFVLLLPYLLFKKPIFNFLLIKPLKYFKLIILFIIVTDLFLVFNNWNKTIYPEEHLEAPSIIKKLKSLPSGRVIRFGNNNIFKPNLLSYYDIEDSQGFSGLTIARYQNFYKKLSPETNAKHTFPIKNFEIENLKTMNDLAINYILSSEKIESKNFKLHGKYDNIFLYQTNNRISKFKVYDDYIVSKEEETIINEKQVVLDRKPLFVNLDKKPLDYNIYEIFDTDESIMVKVNSNKASILFASIPNDGNWKVMINGKSSHTYFANNAFIGVPIEKGESIINFIYNPFLFTIGKYISVFTLCLIIILILVKKRKISFKDSLSKI